MEFKGVEICCPRCQGDLEWSDGAQEQFACKDCASVYPVICGIPDLRIFDDPYISLQDDRDKGRRLAAMADSHDFPGLIDHYYASTKVVTPQQAALYKRGLLAAGARAAAALDAWEEKANRAPPGRLLEVGCGTGPLLVSASERGYQCVGVDIAFRWLIVARKRLEAAGIDVPLICACAEALPFPADSYDRVVLDSVIEHVHDQDRVLSQCSRALVPDGAVYLTTPNRFSIGPDPHTGFLAGSLYPRAITAKLVKRQGGIPPKRQLLSVFSLRKKLKQAGLSGIRMFLPDVPEAQRRHFGPLLRFAIEIYRFCIHLPVLRELLFLVGPVICSVSYRAANSNE